MRFKTLFFISLAIFATALSSPCVGQPSMKTLAVHVVSVAEDGESISVDFRHPVTKKMQRLVFYMDNQSGLSKLKRLKDLRVGQVVSIDYVKGVKGRLLIRRIAKVKLSGPPPGLENFNGI